MSDRTVFGKILLYWAFVIGGLVVAKMFGLTGSLANMAVLFVSLSLVYFGVTLIYANRKK